MENTRNGLENTGRERLGSGRAGIGCLLVCSICVYCLHMIVLALVLCVVSSCCGDAGNVADACDLCSFQMQYPVRRK